MSDDVTGDYAEVRRDALLRGFNVSTRPGGDFDRLLLYGERDLPLPKRSKGMILASRLGKCRFRSRRALVLSEKRGDLNSMPALDHAFGELQRETHQYASLSPEDVSAAIDLSRSFVEQMIRLVPEDARAEQVARVCAKLTFLKDVLFVGVNGSRAVRRNSTAS